MIHLALWLVSFWIVLVSLLIGLAIITKIIIACSTAIRHVPEPLEFRGWRWHGHTRAEWEALDAAAQSGKDKR